MTSLRSRSFDVDAIIERLARLDDPAVFIARASDDDLRTRADELDAIPPDARGPLHGVPFAVKDNIDVAGWRTTAGLPITADAAPARRTAPVVDALLRAGAVLVGKTNLDQLATGLVGTRSPYGTPRNPLDPARIPGGSSSGSAVAVASGIVDFALGTDTAGSGRVPAACTGIVGLKPRPGVLGLDGVVPASPLADTVSVFARSVADATRAAAVMGAKGWFGGSGTFTIGIPARRSLDVLPASIAAGFAHAAASLTRDGHRLVPVELDPFFAAGDLLYGGALLADRTAAIGHLLDDDRPGIDPTVRRVVAGGRAWSGVDAFAALQRLAELRAATAATWAAIDALVVPSVPSVPTLAAVAADPVGENVALGRFTTFVNLLGLAAVTVPTAGPRDGAIPPSVTVVGPAGREPVLRALAAGLAGERPAPTTDPAPGLVDLAVVGAHLRGQPLNGALTSRGAVLVASTTTAPYYRLHRLPGGAVPRPALERVGLGGRAIEVEIWRLDHAALGALTAEVPPPLGIGTVELAGGRWVKGFICETSGLADARDISHYGGWRAYLAAQRDEQ